ncbi:hypothetical protein [Saccharothrix algeriensis]|uniref:Uncharacterized protein n=1 Tax=Saccharothrix algeriensis TaxID=173560 RepID=A0A8T8HSN6_9PSEU|nr:hypothetical protein [Saccharothrix algeriensis]MBM7812671.1 hypothetical protein [Saccharothrix algeriensis]QTR01369.1 hypothetical protein J7S33_18230 [Saccharothrix algeriensis]
MRKITRVALWVVVVVAVGVLLELPWHWVALAGGLPVLSGWLNDRLRRSTPMGREEAFWVHALRDLARRHGWRHSVSMDGYRLTGEHRGVPFELESTVERVHEGGSGEFDLRTTGVLSVPLETRLPPARLSRRDGEVAVEAAEDVGRALRESGFDRWLLERGLTVLDVRPGRLSAPLGEQSAPGVLAQLEFLVLAAEHFPANLRGDRS